MNPKYDKPELIPLDYDTLLLSVISPTVDIKFIEWMALFSRVALAPS